jgi:hypothetical protein
MRRWDGWLACNVTPADVLLSNEFFLTNDFELAVVFQAEHNILMHP